MSKGTVILVLVIVLLFIGGILLYIFYEKPKQVEIDTGRVFFSIYATEKTRNVITGYKVMVNGGLFNEGLTLQNSPIMIEIPHNSSYSVFNYNLPNQSYYTNVQSGITDGNETMRFNLNLIESEPFNIVKTGKLDGNNITLKLQSTNYKDLQTCIKWSKHLIFARLNMDNATLTEVQKPAKYVLYDRCFATSADFTKENSIRYLTISYKYYDTLGSEDFINLVLYDNDCALDSCNSTSEQFLKINNN